jgi:hypothetical protein
MLFIAAKALLTPILLAVCTIVSRRWGDLVGGWLLGLPLASGPVSLFLELQHGAGFAGSAARSTLLGFVAVGVFCATYLALAEKRSWKVALSGSAVACLGVAAGLSLVRLPLAETIIAAVIVLAAIGALLGSAEAARPAPAPSVAGTIGRMAIASALVLTITTCSGLLGGAVSGLLAPMPVLAALMAAAAHRKEGSGAVQGLLRGVVTGMWGGVAFFAVLGLTLGAIAPGLAYLVAVVAAALTGWAATRVASAHPVLRLEQHFQDSALASTLHRVYRFRKGIARRNQWRGIDIARLEAAQRRSERAAA